MSAGSLNRSLTFIASIIVAICSSATMAANSHDISKKETPNIGEKNMLVVRKASERGFSKSSWLKSAFSFSFAGYYDTKHMGFRSLRVMNEDYIKAGSGFDPHPHENMEIITYVLEGSLEHKDSMGNTSVIKAGEVQRMSAGSGVVHSEYNNNKDQETHLYQIWILPNRKGSKPSYSQKSFENELKNQKLVLVASKDARENSIAIAQEVDLYLSRLSKGDKLNFELRPKRHLWAQIIKGKININGQTLSTGDGVSMSPEGLQEHSVNFAAEEDAEFMLFDLI